MLRNLAGARNRGDAEAAIATAAKVASTATSDPTTPALVPEAASPTYRLSDLETQSVSEPPTTPTLLAPPDTAAVADNSTDKTLGPLDTTVTRKAAAALKAAAAAVIYLEK